MTRTLRRTADLAGRGVGERIERALRVVFPPDPGPHHARTEWWWAVAVGAFVGGLTVARVPFMFDRLWAEDGTEFFGDAINNGRLVSLGEWYAGYLHTIPRLLGGVAATLPVRLAPTVFAVGVVLTVAAGSGLVMYRSSAYLRRRWLRVALAALPATLPTVGFEVIGNAANLQFLLVYFAFWMLLWFPTRRTTVALGFVAALLIALSTVLVVFLVPLAVARCSVRRRMGALGPPLALLAGTAVQVIGRVLAGADRPDLGVRGVGAATALEWFDGVVVAVLRPGHPPPVVYGTVSLAVAVSVAVVVAVALVPKLRTSTTAIAPGTAASMIVITAGLGIVMWFTLAFQVGMAVRYGVPTTLFLITSLIVAIDFALDARPDLVARVPATFLLVTFAIATVFAWPPSDLRDEVDRSWSQAIDDARGTCLATSDQWALLPTTPRGWTVYVSCRELLEDP